MLQLGQLLMRDTHPAEMAEAGRDAIYLLTLIRHSINYLARGLDACQRFASQRNWGIVTGHREHVSAGQRLTLYSHLRREGRNNICFHHWVSFPGNAASSQAL